MSLMVLGTASHVGKSIMVAALCRALVNRGMRVAPFKSQNMSLNSYVTRDGSEIGIAQAMQAFAARLEPRAEMNPILLKPKGDQISQVMLLGRPYKDVPASEYYKETDSLLQKALESAAILQKEFGHLVVEGAGGAAEMNLYSRDIANILLARSLRFPIVLVADIERGGIFAQVYGTLELLPEDIRPLVKGVIVNKFRGDKKIFEEGIRILEEIAGVPVLGVLPYLDLPLPSEDSLSLGDKKARSYPVRIAILRFRHISNFTDFERLESRACVEYVPPGAPLSGYDCIILPGTKNTIADLLLIHETGCAGELIHARRNGIPIIGICGGYQMLGREIIDSGVESRAGTYKGLGLLDVVTRFDAYEKKTEQRERTGNPIGPILSRIGTVKGYEIHMGITERRNAEDAFAGEGAATSDGLVIGTYLHGLFENPGAADALLSYLYSRKGLPYTPDAFPPDPYDALADAIETNLRMDLILRFFQGTDN
ncbi:MAG: cobyric acid synthase [Methanolinea sp.]|nr:cobyric acid synthase [Methanolinea sp.]